MRNTAGANLSGDPPCLAGILCPFSFRLVGNSCTGFDGPWLCFVGIHWGKNAGNGDKSKGIYSTWFMFSQNCWLTFSWALPGLVSFKVTRSWHTLWSAASMALARPLLSKFASTVRLTHIRCLAATYALLRWHLLIWGVRHQRNVTHFLHRFNYWFFGLLIVQTVLCMVNTHWIPAPWTATYSIHLSPWPAEDCEYSDWRRGAAPLS